MLSKVAIVGGGIGGLTAALALLRSGIDVDVYEQAPELKELGAGVQISANGTRVLYALGLGAAIERVGVIVAGKEIRLWNTGQIWKLFDLDAVSVQRYGFPYMMFHRGDLHGVLLDAIKTQKSDAIRLDHKCIGVEQSADSVAMTFENGKAAHAPIVIGADGVQSRLRACLFDADRPEFTGIVAWRGLIPRAAVPASVKMDVGSNWVGPGGHVVHYPVRGGALLNFVGLVETDAVSEELWTVKFPWERLKADYRGWHPIVQAVIDAADRDQCYRWSLHNRAPIRTWSTDRATLLGDAAHPTLPYLAQGAAMAMEDGVVLARTLEIADSIPVALRQYERNRVDRTARIVLQSSENRKLFHLRTVDEIRAAFSNRNEGADRNRWLYSYNPLSVALS